MDKHKKVKPSKQKPGSKEKMDAKEENDGKSSFYNEPGKHEYVILDEVENNDAKGFEHIDLEDDESEQRSQTAKTSKSDTNLPDNNLERDRIEYPDIE